MITDANDILGNKHDNLSNKKNQYLLNKNNLDKKPIKKLDHKRPNGMHRELFNLLVHQGKDNNIHSLFPTCTKKGYTNAKAKLGIKKARKWFWKPFINPGRKDNLQLMHWERDDQTNIYPFAKLNKFVDPITFTDLEYDDHLIDPKWTKDETLHLLELCHRFDLRWPIIVDRFDCNISTNKKCMEDLKERYYNIINFLRVARSLTNKLFNNGENNDLSSVDQPYFGYDADHEKRRKKQLNKLWERTEEQIKEEEELKGALKRIELKRKEREKKAYDLQRLINATDRTSLSPDGNVAGLSTTNRVKRKLKIKSAQAAAVQLISPSDTLSIRYHEFRTSGPHLRSQEMKMPCNIGQKKQKNIDIVIDKLKLDLTPHGMEEIVELFNTFRSNIVVLQDLKTALHAAEIELDSLNGRLKFEKKTCIKIEPRMRVSETNIEANSESSSPTRLRNKSFGMPISSRRITNWIDINPGGLITSRRKKVRQLSPYEGNRSQNR